MCNKFYFYKLSKCNVPRETLMIIKNHVSAITQKFSLLSNFKRLGSKTENKSEKKMLLNYMNKLINSSRPCAAVAFRERKSKNKKHQKKVNHS